MRWSADKRKVVESRDVSRDDQLYRRVMNYSFTICTASQRLHCDLELMLRILQEVESR